MKATWPNVWHIHFLNGRHKNTSVAEDKTGRIANEDATAVNKENQASAVNTENQEFRMEEEVSGNVPLSQNKMEQWQGESYHKKEMSSKNKLEQYVFKVKLAISDKSIVEKISVRDRKQAAQTYAEVSNWLEHNQSAEMIEYEDMLKKMQAVFQSIIMKCYLWFYPLANPPSSQQSTLLSLL